MDIVIEGDEVEGEVVGGRCGANDGGCGAV